MRRALAVRAVLPLGVLAGALAVVVARRDAALLCREGLVRAGPRCCVAVAASGRCTSAVGPALATPVARVRFDARPVAIRGQSFERARPESVSMHLTPFSLAVTETRCGDALAILGSEASPVTARLCAEDPERAAGGLRLADAERICAALGGRLPTEEEWERAAGSGGTRYPWGETGATCRVAVWSMTEGPCAHGLDGPDTAHARPGGVSPEGLVDLAGNAAEWTLRDGRPAVLKGGDYASVDPAALRVLAWRPAPPEDADPRNGVRCAFPAAP